MAKSCTYVSVLISFAATVNNMKIIEKVITAFILVATSHGSVNAQSYNVGSGGYNTGYGTVYGTFGLASATQSIFNQMQIQMNMNLLRASGKKNYGPTVMQPGEVSASPSIKPVPPRPVPKNYGRFKSDVTVDTAKTIADALGETPEEKALYKQIFAQTKSAFEKEAAARGWKNNIAGAFTFFIVANATIYHDSTDPSDETVAAIFDAMNQTIDEIPEFAKMPNREKQALYNTLVGFAGIPLATYAEGKQSNDQPTIKVARQLAGHLIEIVLRTSRDRFRFESGEMRFN